MSDPRIDHTQEVRFAVVMYGGVSLAIYINGVAQELLQLVRATAAAPDDGNRPLVPGDRLRGAARVYRELGQILGTADGTRLARADASQPVQTRFVVDVLSGTSAGGINAVFLAKALANDQPIERLKSLWLREGDLARLLNDAGSADGGLRAPRTPASLLNSQRMYRELLDAMDGMDAAQPAAAVSPCADEIDLFVTATDLQGIPVQLRLADKPVEERRHRKVFHFRYRRRDNGRPDGSSDFARRSNPLLAFAARCTSSFPFAFEPMQLADVDPVIGTMPRRGPGDALAGTGDWERIFAEHAASEGAATGDALREELLRRSFADGGYLDNKPFGFAIDALSTRRSTLPVSRKLLYVEPAPEPPPARGPGARPDAIANTLSAFSLARYETIREDVERILARNRLAQRVERILAGVEDDVAAVTNENALAARPGVDFAQLDLTDMVRTWGPGYGGYHRLKVSTLTDDIAAIVGKAAGLDMGSDIFDGLRYLVQAWRSLHYALTRPPAGTANAPPHTENRFLLEYDLTYRIRRLNFVIARIDRLYCLDDEALRMLHRRGRAAPAGEHDRQVFRAELMRLRPLLMSVLAGLEREHVSLRAGAEPTLLEGLDGPPVTAQQLRALLDPLTERQRQDAARVLYHQPGVGPALERVAANLATRIGNACRDAADACAAAFTQAPIGAAEAHWTTIARTEVEAYYSRFECYDLITFPTLHATELGEESARVDVFRVSPQDTRYGGPHKLAGTTLMNFGAFLDRRWRWNDMLWGRLDGAERIIAALLPGDSPERRELREQLTREAHMAILEEEVGAEHERIGAQRATAAATGDPIALKQDPVAASPLRPAAAAMDAGRLYDFFAGDYDVDRHLDPKAATRMAGRSVRLVSGMLQGVAGGGTAGQRLTVWTARVGALVWGLVEVAVPGGLPELWFRHWRHQLFVFGILLTVLGAVFTVPPVWRLGLAIVGVCLLATLGVAAVADRLDERRRWLAPPLVIVAGAILVLAAIGLGSVITSLDAGVAVGGSAVRSWLAAAAARIRGMSAGTLLANGAVVVAAIVAARFIRRWWQRRRATGAAHAIAVEGAAAAADAVARRGGA